MDEIMLLWIILKVNYLTFLNQMVINCKELYHCTDIEELALNLPKREMKTFVIAEPPEVGKVPKNIQDPLTITSVPWKWKAQVLSNL